MKMKRAYTRQLAKRRKRQRQKQQREIDKFRLDRNKALKEAKQATELATAKEEKRQAKLKRAKAKGITSKKQIAGKGLLKDITKGAKALLKDVTKASSYGKKTRKKRTTKNVANEKTY